MTESTLLSIAVQVLFTVIPILLYVERRITRLEVKVDIIWKLMQNPSQKDKEGDS